MLRRQGSSTIQPTRHNARSSGTEMFRQLIGPDEGADAGQLCVRAALLLVFGIVCIRIAGRRTFAQ